MHRLLTPGIGGQFNESKAPRPVQALQQGAPRFLAATPGSSWCWRRALNHLNWEPCNVQASLCRAASSAGPCARAEIRSRPDKHSDRYLSPFGYSLTEHHSGWFGAEQPRDQGACLGKPESVDQAPRVAGSLTRSAGRLAGGGSGARHGARRPRPTVRPAALPATGPPPTTRTTPRAAFPSARAGR